MVVEVKDGPNGPEGGVYYPYVAEIMEKQRADMAKTPRFAMKMMKYMPKKVIAKAMREHFGAPNKDIAGDGISTHEMTIDGPNGPIDFRYYKPAGENLNVFIYFHGGGWVAGSVDVVENICRGIAEKTGWLVMNVDYRLAPENPFPAGLEDCYASIVWASEHASEIGGDPSRISAGGDSAGGGLTASCCLLLAERGGPKLQSQVLAYPGIDLRPEALGNEDLEEQGFSMTDIVPRLYLKDIKSVYNPLASPMIAADLSVMPPTMVITAEFCFIRDQGEAFGEKLAAAGVPVKAFRYNGFDHAFLDWVGVWPEVENCIADIADYLKSV